MNSSSADGVTFIKPLFRLCNFTAFLRSEALLANDEALVVEGGSKVNAEKENDGEDVMDDGFVSTRGEEADQVNKENNA